MTREAFERELETLREQLLRMATQVESQIETALGALRRRDRDAADSVRRHDQDINEQFRQIREQCFSVISTQQPVARDLRALMGIQFIATELERMGDYAVRIARMTGTLAELPQRTLRAEFGIMGQLAARQVHDIVDALIEGDEARARDVAAKDDEIDRLYRRVFDDLIQTMASESGEEETLEAVTLMLVAHNLERIGDRVTNVAEDIVFLASGQVVELG